MAESVDDEFAAAEALLEALERGETPPPPRDPDRQLQSGDWVTFNRSEAGFRRHMYGSDLPESDFVRGGDTLTGRVLSIDNPDDIEDIVQVEVYMPEEGDRPANALRYRVRRYSLVFAEDPGINVPEFMNEITSKTAAIVEKIRRLKAEKKRKAEEEAERKRKEEEAKLLAGVEERVEIIKKICEEIHPGRWDFAPIAPGEWQYSDTGKFRVVIHFPEITISNSNGESRQITDLYVQYLFNHRMEHTGGLYGNRGTYSYAEYSSGYNHSHLRGGNDQKWRNFCLGSNTVMSNTIGGLSADRWNPDLFQTALVALYGYVEWESLEGGPHFRMSGVGNRGSSGPRRIADSTKVDIYNKFIARYDDFPVTLDKDGSFEVFKVNPNDLKLEEMVTALCDTSLKSIKDANGTFIQRANNNGAARSNAEEYNRISEGRSLDKKIVFKGQVIATRCNEFDVQEDTDTVLVANPEITKYIAQKLQEEINNYQLKTESYELSGR